MEMRDRTTVIAELARRKKGKPGRLGKTAVMKLLHILQDGLGLSLGYRFSLYNYGPYDSEVMSDIGFAEVLGQVSVAYLGEDQGYAIEPTPSIGVSQLKPEAIRKIEILVRDFGGMNARELELRSTLLYLANELAGRQLVDRLRELKPKYSDTETISALKQMVSFKLVSADRATSL